MEKKNERQNGLNKIVKNVINISERGQKKLCLLSTVTNEVYKVSLSIFVFSFHIPKTVAS